MAKCARRFATPFVMFLLFMIFAGYTVGKDLAERENARDRIAAQEAAR
jgi:hypothetical protein